MDYTVHGVSKSQTRLSNFHFTSSPSLHLKYTHHLQDSLPFIFPVPPYMKCQCLCMISCFSHVQLFATLRTVACQVHPGCPMDIASLPMGFSRKEYWKKKKRKEYWSGLSCPPLGIFSTQGLNLSLLHLLHWHVGSLTLSPPEKPKFQCILIFFYNAP